MNITLEVVKIDNKFGKNTAHIKATMSDGKLLSKTVWLYSDVQDNTKVGQKADYTADEFRALSITQKESKSNPGQFYNVVTL
jgi:hypothetical protein